MLCAARAACCSSAKLASSERSASPSESVVAALRGSGCQHQLSALVEVGACEQHHLHLMSEPCAALRELQAGKLGAERLQLALQASQALAGWLGALRPACAGYLCQGPAQHEGERAGGQLGWAAVKGSRHCLPEQLVVLLMRSCVHARLS